MLHCCLTLCCCLVVQSCLTFCDLMDSSPPGSSDHGDSPGNNTGVGCHALLQCIFLTQGSNLNLLCLPHCRQILYPLNHLGSSHAEVLLLYSIKSENQAKNVTSSLLTKQLEILKISNWFSPNSFNILLSCLLDRHELIFFNLTRN